MNPEYTAALEAAVAAAALRPSHPSGPPTISQARAQFNESVTLPSCEYHNKLLPPASTYTVKDELVAVDGGNITLRCITPTKSHPQQTFPLFFHIHGGGGCVGSIELDDPILRRLSVDFQLIVTNVDYRLAPEHPFPTGINDCIAALKWIVQNASSLGADLSQGFIIGGHSAGARKSAVLAHELRDDPFFKDTPLTGQLLREPMAIMPGMVPERFKSQYKAYDEHAATLPLTRPVLEGLRKMYAADESDPRAAPLMYPSHEKLPPAYIHVMGADPLRDDGIIYEQALREAGVKTKIKVFPGVGHGFYYSFPTLDIAQTVLEDARSGLKWLLGRVE